MSNSIIMDNKKPSNIIQLNGQLPISDYNDMYEDIGSEYNTEIEFVGISNKKRQEIEDDNERITFIFEFWEKEIENIKANGNR